MSRIGRWFGLWTRVQCSAAGRALLICGAWLVLVPARAQESLRMSLASADAARVRREAAARSSEYNLQLGPTAWSFGGALSLQYNDNLRNSSVAQQQDLITRPQLDTRMHWSVSDVNALDLSVGAGYAIYATHPEYDRPFVTPGSELSFDLYAGDFWVNLHDRFAIIENGYLDPTVTGIGDYERLDNAAGLTATWDLNKVVVKVGYDHVNYIALGGLRTQPDAVMEVFSSSAGYLIKPGLQAGLEAGVSLVHYASVPNNPLSSLYYSDGTQWSVGGFYDAQLTEYIRGRLSAGYTRFLPDSELASLLGQDFSGVYAQVTLMHRLNRFLEYSLSGGRMLNFAYYGGKVDQYFATLAAAWHIFQKTSLGTTFSYQHGLSLSFTREEYDWFGPGLVLERRLTSKLTGSVGYQYYWRGSNLPDRGYSVNVATVRANYKF
jgi:hypothetical protein